MSKRNIIKTMILVTLGTILVSGFFTIIIVRGYTDKHYTEKFVILNDKIDNKAVEIAKHDSLINMMNSFFSEDFIVDNTVGVGINTSLHGNEVSIYNDEKIRFLKEGEKITIRNHRHNYKPSAELLVIDVKMRRSDTIRANVFISTEVARMLGVDEKQQKKMGVFNMKLKKITN